MGERQRPDHITTCTPLELYQALREAWPKVVADSPGTRESCLVLLAHWALETGFGHAMHWYNIGNKKHVAGDGRDFCVFRCNEVQNGQVVWLDCAFVAFDSLELGAEDYLAGLHGRFGAAWLDAVAGDVPKFCHDLKVERYYTADETQYTAGVLRCYHQLDALIGRDTQPDRIVPVNREAVVDDEVLEVGQEPPAS
jgi:hypothetical protein